MLSGSGYDPDATTFPGLHGPVYNVKAFGAKGDGTTDDTAAIQAAVTAASVAGGVVRIPVGTYLVTNTITIAEPGVRIVGDGYTGSYGSTIKFNPATANVCFDFIHSNAAVPLFGCGIEHVVGTSTNAIQKTFLRLTDVSEFTLANVRSDASIAGAGSIGLEVKGREFVRARNCTFFADKPMVLSQNPRHASIDIDTFTFHDTYLGATDGTYYNVTIGNTGVAEIRSLRNLCFDGLFMVQGKGGLSWISTVTSGAQDCIGFLVHRGGIEQTMDATGYFLDIEKVNSTLYNVDLKHIQPASTGQHGIKLRHVSHTAIDNLQWPDTGGSRKVLDLDSTCAKTSWRNLWTQIGAGFSLTGQTLVRASGRSSSGDFTLPPNAEYDNAPTIQTTEGDFKLTKLGGGLFVKEGVGASMGVATLVAGVATVTPGHLTANSRIQLTSNNDSGTPGFVRVSNRSGTAFTIQSSSASDTSAVAWLLVEPA
jgi:hypothetical protein